jgi:nonsense-mediated mRNA decay protein 3
MSESRGFCPRCGDQVERSPDVDLPGARGRQQGLCDACYFEDFDLVDAPDRLTVRTCGSCGAVHRGNRWVDVGARDLTDVALEEVSEALGVHVDAEAVSWGVEPEQVDASTVRMHATFTGVVRGTAVEESVTVPVTMASETCDRCGRIAGGSYAAVVQVRGEDRDLTARERERVETIAREYVAAREETGDRNAFVTEAGAVDGGFDVKISTTQMGQGVASRVIRQLGGSVDRHEELVTEDEDGEPVYRITYAVRLPPYTAGDVVDPEDGDGPVLVESVQGNLKGTRLATGERYEADYEDGDAPDAVDLGHVDDAVETTLVAVTDEHAVQVLDPETYETKTVPRPDFLDVDAEQVPVLKHRNGLHAVPPDALDDDG